MHKIKFFPDIGSGARPDGEYHHICPVNIRVSGSRRRSGFFVCDARGYSAVDATAKAGAIAQLVADSLNADVRDSGDFHGRMYAFAELFQADAEIVEAVYLNRCEPDLHRLLEKLVNDRRARLVAVKHKTAPVLRMTLDEAKRLAEELDAAEDSPAIH